MPLNVPGLLVPFHLLVNPRLIVPHIVVKDIRQIDFRALKKAGYRGAVFDKDNCLTLPHHDTLIPELQDSWRECREVFGEGNILVVSNSAGTKQRDAGGILAESVSYHLGVPVLRHASLKPSYACIKGIRAYFASLQAPRTDSELIIVGDRIFTDVVLANRMRSNPSSPGPLAIWMTRVWKKEGTFMRWMEGRLVRAVEAWSEPIGSSGLGSRFRDGDEGGQDMNLRRFVKDDEVEGEAKVGGSKHEGAAVLGIEAGGIGRWVWERMKRS
ncbi:hypothetical protein PILCRDRAFT_70627 [Piloderma croceum F 1598]|uniref:Uncharacterized protein n=1 Tax=Piloderma croceum (strain F 1598) TaxID=765440 RepID=A0A0C3BYT0_PILCF|nr:hypothetical protein PILCRDRAFT_70627 [Piloderma croceum F 1598]